MSKMRHGFKRTQYRQPVNIHDGFDAAFAHSLSATAKELEGIGRDFPQQVGDELRGIHVAGSFSRHNQNRLGLRTHEGKGVKAKGSGVKSLPNTSSALRTQ